MYNIKDLRKNEVQLKKRNVLSKTFRMIYDTPTKCEKLVIGDEENNIPPPLD